MIDRAPSSTAHQRNIRIRSSEVARGLSMRPYTSCARAPVMETSNPLNVLMKAANAPAHVMPLKTDPKGAWRSLSNRGSSSTILSVPLAPAPA